MDLGQLLAERERRRVEAATSEIRAANFLSIAEWLREWYSDKQREVFAIRPDRPKKIATLKTRRSGASSGGVHEFIARALTIQNWRGRYVNEIREEAKGLVWRADTKQGFIDIIEALRDEGRLVLADRRHGLGNGADLKVDEQALTIDFSNGSQIRIFAADDQRSQERGRGGAPHVLWVDEAQKYPGLRKLVEEIFGPSMLDHDGETWLSGTPDEWAGSMFYDITQDDDLTIREPGWSVVDWSVLDNPFFGATREERFDKVIRKVILGKKPLAWTDTDDAWVAEFLKKPPPWFQREWQAKWTREDQRFVYSVQRWPSLPNSPLLFAPIRTSPITPLWLREVNLEGADPSGISGYIDRWYDHAAAVRDLPRYLPGTDTVIDWFFGLGADFGYNPDPFAVVLWAFSPMWPVLHEMFSWKRTLVLPDYQRDCIRWFFEQVPLVYADGDPGGLQGAHLEGWRELLGIPMDDAEKSAKRTWQEMMNNDGERGRIKLREGGVLHHEMKYLRWIKSGQKVVEGDNVMLPDKTIPGRDCCDGGLYSYRRYISRNTDDAPPPPPQAGTPEWYAAEEAKMRSQALETSRRAIAEEAGADEW